MEDDDYRHMIRSREDLRRSPEALGSINNDSSLIEQIENHLYSDEDLVRTGSLEDLQNWRRVALSWKNITVRTCEKNNDIKDLGSSSTNSKPILDNVSGTAPAGQLLAIMGHSGSGKTTLLNVLNGRNLKKLDVGGSVFVHGASPDLFNDVRTAFVQQDDLFINTLTVREHLNFQATVRMSKTPKRVRDERVKKIVSEMSLQKCIDTKIGSSDSFKSISGGEMKRLSFATEIMDDPQIMFCDEPTSGLDSYMAHAVVSVLKDMASKGRTVICTIHQPSSNVFSLFDRLLLLVEGRVGFMGSKCEAQSFFSEAGMVRPVNYNPADFYLQMISPNTNGHYSQSIADVFEEKSHLYECLDQNLAYRGFLDTTPRSRSSWLVQFQALMFRSFLTIVRQPLLSVVRFIQLSFVSLMIGLLYFNQEMDQEGVMNINGVLFLLLMCVTFQNLFGVITVFCNELPIFLREHSDGLYGTSAYFLSKTFAELPIFILQPFVLTSVVYYMVDLNQSILHYLICAATVVLVANVVTSFGYMVSCASSSTQMALTIGTPLIIPLMIFGGYFIKNDAMPECLQWIQYLSWFHHGFHALAINQWGDIGEIACSRNNITFCLKSGPEVLDFLHFTKDDLQMNFAFLGVLLVAFRLLAFGALSIRSLEQR